LQFGRRCVNEEDNLNALFCPVQSKNKAIRKSFIKALVLDSVVFVGVLTQKSDIVEGRLFQVMRYVGLGKFSD